MTLVGIAVHGVGGNFVHLVVAATLAWGFVAGQVATFGIAIKRGERQ